MDSLSTALENKNDELLECFDEHGSIIPPQPRKIVHSQPVVVWHGVTAVWLINDQGLILCSKRGKHNDGNPNKWQTYFGGHVKAGNSFEETAVAELWEEIGLECLSDKLFFIDSGKRADVMHVYKMYAVLFNEPLNDLKFVDEEVSEARWLSFQDYQAEINSNTADWCNGMNADQYKKIVEVLGLEPQGR